MNPKKENRQINFFSTLVFLMIFSFGFAHSFPLDFEYTTIPYPFTNFDEGVVINIANPQISSMIE